MRETGKIQQIKVLKKNKVDFVTMACCNSEGRDKVAITTRDHSVLIYDMKNVGGPIFTIPPPKSNTSSSPETCRVQWDRTDSVLLLVGGEDLFIYVETPSELFRCTMALFSKL